MTMRRNRGRAPSFRIAKHTMQARGGILLEPAKKRRKETRVQVCAIT